MDNTVNQEIFQIIRDAIGRSGKSNCVLPFKTVQKKIEEGKIDIIDTNPVLLVERKRTYNQLFYFLDESSSVSDMKSVVQELERHNPLYADIVMKEDFRYEDSIFQNLEMRPFRTYVRKSTINLHKKYRAMIETVFADEADLESIYDMLQNTFDEMCDHIPDKAELEKLIADENVYKVTVQKDIAGVLLFEDTGVKSYARALCVSQSFQGGAIGYSLMSNYFNHHIDSNTKMFYLWVDEANAAVKKLHSRFGYAEDGLKDYIFRRGDV